MVTLLILFIIINRCSLIYQYLFLYKIRSHHRYHNNSWGMNDATFMDKVIYSNDAGFAFLFTAFYMLYPTLPLFIKEMGGNEKQVGLAMGALMLSSVILRPFVGGLLDRFGRRPFMIGGCFYLYWRCTCTTGLVELSCLLDFVSCME